MRGGRSDHSTASRPSWTFTARSSPTLRQSFPSCFRLPSRCLGETCANPAGHVLPGCSLVCPCSRITLPAQSVKRDRVRGLQDYLLEAVAAAGSSPPEALLNFLRVDTLAASGGGGGRLRPGWTSTRLPSRARLRSHRSGDAHGGHAHRRPWWASGGAVGHHLSCALICLGRAGGQLHAAQLA